MVLVKLVVVMWLVEVLIEPTIQQNARHAMKFIKIRLRRTGYVVPNAASGGTSYARITVAERLFATYVECFKLKIKS